MAAGDGTETLTIRLPKGLKGLVEEAAKAHAMTVTGVVRQALQQTLKPVGRMYQQPGLSDTFTAFLEQARARPGMSSVLVLVVDENSGGRYFFSGPIDHDLTNESLLAIRRGGDTSWIIPRRDVIAWFDGASVVLNKLRRSLARQGWAERPAA